MFTSRPAPTHAGIRRATSWLVMQLVCLAALTTTWRTRLAERDDDGLSTPEKAALTVLGLGLAGVFAAAAYSYVNGKVGELK